MASSNRKQKYFQLKPVSRAVVAACGITAAALVAVPTLAQEAQLEEIIVTATKRSETMQEIPQAATTARLTGSKL